MKHDEKEAINSLFESVNELDDYPQHTKDMLKACIDRPYAFIPLFMKLTQTSSWDIPDNLLKYVKD